MVRDTALLVARLILAWVFIYHGAGTLFGAFGGAGLHRQAAFYSQVAGLRPGMLVALVGGIIECFGGIAVGIGVLARLAALALVGDMVLAMITVTWAHGLGGDAAGSGYELNLALAALALVVALLGTGRLALGFLLGARAGDGAKLDQAPRRSLLWRRPGRQPEAQ